MRTTAFIFKAYNRIGYYVQCSLMRYNVFFNEYWKAKDFAEAHGWDIVRL